MFFTHQPTWLRGGDDSTPPEAPNLASLQTNWWAFFEGSRAEVEPQIDSYLKDTNELIADLQPQNQEFALSTLDALRDNLTVLMTLLDEAEAAPQTLTPAAASYSIEEMLGLSAIARDAREAAADEQLEVDRERRVLNGASRYRDNVFNDYLDADVGENRWLAGLKLMQARSVQAVSKRRLDLLTQRSKRAADYAKAALAHCELAMDRLATTVDEAKLDQIIIRLDANTVAVKTAEEKLRTSQIAASGLDSDTTEGRSQQRLQQQKLLGAEISLARARAALARTSTQRWWTEIFLNMAAPDTETLENQALEWSEFIRSVKGRAPEWKQLTEEELLTVQSDSRDGLDRASRRLLDQRLATAKTTLTQVRELNAEVADLELLTRSVDNITAEYTGVFKSWLSGLSRTARTAYIRGASVADVTLFSVGETPVAGTDILRALVILLVAFLLSRGTRLAIKRVSDKEPGGAKASLYTLGRLSHYTIVILGLFIALSSIGLDFSNLALVAGALSVGIGFGLQAIVNNFVSGLIILFEHSLRVGDYIELDTGLTGTVKSINVRSTLINTNDNIDIVVPNSEFVTTRLTNWTLGERILRIRIPFGVAYGSDKELVRKAAIEAAAEVPFTLTHMKNRDPEVWLTEFADNSLNFLLLVWVNRMGARRPTRARAAYLWELETKLTEYGIEIPFPQRDLHLRSGWPSTTTPDTNDGE